MSELERQTFLKKKKDFSRSISLQEDELKSFRTCIKWMCIDQSNRWRASLSFSMFFLLSIVVPALAHFRLACGDCEASHRRPYDGIVQLSLTSLAAVSFLTLSRIIAKSGLRRHLYINKLCDQSQMVRLGYTTHLQKSMKILSLFVLPCFVAEAAYKIWWYTSRASEIPFFGNVFVSDALAFILEISSWLYRTSIFFLVCILFRVICSLQILRLQDFARVFKEESDVQKILKEHLRIRGDLRVISHRYRLFILSALLIITFSLLASLLSTVRPHADVNIYWSGELALCALTLMAGFYILLRSATKITHRTQSVTSLASKWHVCATIESFEEHEGETPRAPIITPDHVVEIHVNDEESEEDDAGDEEDEIDNTMIFFPAYAQTISFQKRQALVTYFENNRAGITVYGFMLDRSYLHTIFGIELTLVLWLLQKTIQLS